MSAAPISAPVQAPGQNAPVHPAPAKPTRRWLWLLLLVVVIAGGYALYRSRSAAPEPPRTAAGAPRIAPVVTGSVEKVLRLTGQTSAREFRTITAPILRGPENRGSLILLRMVPSGSYVKKGDFVLEIDGQSARDHIDDVNDTVQAAESDVRKRRAEQEVEWKNLEQTVAVAKAEWAKAQLDYKPAEVRTDIERQLLRLSLEEAEARYNQAQKDLAFKKAAHAAEIRILELTRERHVRHRDRHVSDLQRYTIQAPISGLAVMSSVFRGGEMLQIRDGDQVFPGQQILKIVEPNSMQVEANVNQAESSLLRIGQKVRITFDAFKDMEVTGKVATIGALATRGSREQYYIRNMPVRVALDKQDARIIPDLSVGANIILDSVQNATVIPAGTIVREQGRTYAFVKAGEGFEKREIQLGLESDTHAQVLGGLKPGEEVRFP